MDRSSQARRPQLEDTMTELRVKKCPCGDKGCRSYWVEPLWNYSQGAGCGRDDALEIKTAMIATYPGKYSSGADDQ
jgi:hypothetical protein